MWRAIGGIVPRFAIAGERVWISHALRCDNAFECGLPMPVIGLSPHSLDEMQFRASRVTILI